MSTTRTRAVRTAMHGLLLTALCLAAAPSGAQSVQGEPTDLLFAVVNATTREPGSIDRMTIDYVRNRPNNILDFEPAGAEFTAPAVPIKDGGMYIVTVWHQDVPYWWSKRGHELTAGVNTLNVFDTAKALDGVSISGLNLVVRRQETLVNLEYMLQVTNATRPQVTVYDPEGTLRLDFPSGTARVEANYRRGPDPTEIPVSASGSHLDLAVPLTPGTNQIQITASLPWVEGMELPVGADAPIAAWSLLASPDWLEIRAMELETAESDVPGFSRFSGPELEAGRTFDLRLHEGARGAQAAEDLFSRDAPTEATAPATTAGDEEDGGLPLPFVFVGVLIIIVFIAAIRRRG